MPAPKPPTFRGFTVAEDRALTFERVTLWLVLGVAVIAAVASFSALTWCAQQFMEPWVAPLLPLAIDGFAIACSVGIVTSKSSGGPGRDRFVEWAGLILALGLSVAGNVAHALQVLPNPLVVALAASVPAIVAYGIHVYTRAMGRGVSSRVMVEDPTRIRDDEAPAARPAPARRVQPAPMPTVTRPAGSPEPARMPTVERPAGSPPPVPMPTVERAPRVGDVEREAAYAEYARARDAGEPEWEGGVIAARLGVHPGNARNVRKAWRARYAEERGTAQPAAEPEPERAPEPEPARVEVDLDALVAEQHAARADHPDAERVHAAA